MPFERMPVLEAGNTACLCCGRTETQLCDESRIAVGFGIAFLSRDGEVVWREECDTEWEDCISAADAEAMAKDDPDHDWRIVLNGPLRGRTYQRQAEATWLLIEQNLGFA